MVSNSDLARRRRVPAGGGRAGPSKQPGRALCVRGPSRLGGARQERALGVRLTARCSGWGVSAPRGGARRGSERACGRRGARRSARGREVSGGVCTRGGREDARRGGRGLLARRARADRPSGGARAPGGGPGGHLRSPGREGRCQVSGDFSVAGGTTAAGDVLAAGRLPWECDEGG